ncbi:Hsp20/alpha crystallin family protein [Halarchaeum sp. P4]|uniref:Hsp20/alpha crystallin family protein n=1 Tax=Halarchaeum sp. P4 TaxID=3421639 RepID=UPI003EBCFC0A
MLDTPEEVHVFADLPGCDRDRIELRARENRLRIRADREDDAAGEGRVHRRERSRTVDRTVDLPARADVDEARASYENGVLRITLPKREEERERPIGFE